MNRTNIEWCDYTWNPVTGCLNGCSYCYARRFAERGLGEYGKHPKGERFKPRIHPDRLDEPARVKKSSRVFVCSMADLFGYWVRDAWVMAVLRAASDAPWHTYQWLTKNPEGLAKYTPYWSDLDWVGVSVSTNDHLWLADSSLAKCGGARVRFISAEPLLTPLDMSQVNAADWIIVGAQTGPKAVRPKPEWVQGILDFADEHAIPVFLKNNLNWPVARQEFPEEVLR